MQVTTLPIPVCALVPPPLTQGRLWPGAPTVPPRRLPSSSGEGAQCAHWAGGERSHYRNSLLDLSAPVCPLGQLPWKREPFACGRASVLAAGSSCEGPYRIGLYSSTGVAAATGKGQAILQFHPVAPPRSSKVAGIPSEHLPISATAPHGGSSSVAPNPLSGVQGASAPWRSFHGGTTVFCRTENGGNKMIAAHSGRTSPLPLRKGNNEQISLPCG